MNLKNESTNQELNRSSRDVYLPGLIAILLWSAAPYLIYQMKHIHACQILVVGQFAGGLISVSLEKGGFSFSRLLNRIKRGWPYLFSFWISQLGYVFAFQNAPPAQVDLIFYTWPAILIIIKSWQISRGMNIWDIAGISIGFMGVFVLLYPDLTQEILSTQYILGYIGGIIGAIGWVGYLLNSELKDAKKTGFSSIGEDVLILGMINFCLIMGTNQWVNPNEREWMMLTLYAVGMFGMPYYLWSKTLEKAPKMASAFSNATPVLSIIWLILAGITAFTVELIAALIMVNAGIYCIDRSQLPRKLPE